MAHGDTAPELFLSDAVFFSKELPQQLQYFYWNQAHDGLSISQLFGLKGHKVSPATQNPECPMFQFSLRVCGMVRGDQWIKSNDFSKILLKIIVVWKIFITVPYSVFIKLTALVWITEKWRALFSTLTRSGSPLFYYSAPLTHYFVHVSRHGSYHS